MTGVLVVCSELGSALAVGFASALVPLVNAEAAVTAAGLGLPATIALTSSVALAVGQTAGKLCIFEAASRGVRLRADRRQKRQPPDWQVRLMQRLDGRWKINGVVLLSAVIGLPPLLLVSVAAGAMRSRRMDFLICCLFGRTARFLALTAAVIWAW